MDTNVLQYLEASALNYPDKEAFEDVRHSMTFSQVLKAARAIGSRLLKQGVTKSPVAVFMDKNIESIVSFLGVLYSGNFYCPLDSQMPLIRIDTILDVLRPVMILTDELHLEAAREFAWEADIVLYEEACLSPADEKGLREVRENATELDPLYVLFTSGSTGIPKGVLLNHRVVTNYIEWLEQAFAFTSDEVFGNQAPLYFDVSIHDIYAALRLGAKMVIIAPELFCFPVKLIEFMNEKRVTAFLWVPSAMGIIASLKAFETIVPEYLKYIMFAGEVLPRRQLNYWMKHLPEAVYANLYGPTETFVCTCYILDGSTPEDTALPIGRPIGGAEALILNEDQKPAAQGEEGELCIRGSCLALGYYRNPERTSASFIQNPCNDCYPDRIYRTGDLVRLDENGNIIYISRKDFQIKHMGYRIELGEIETAAGTLRDIRDCACTYDAKRQRIVLYYDGMEWEKAAIEEHLAARIPRYMMPGRIVHLEQMPHNANGKIDRKQLGDM